MRRTRAGASPRKTRGGKVTPKKKLGAGNLPRIKQGAGNLPRIAKASTNNPYGKMLKKIGGGSKASSAQGSYKKMLKRIAPKRGGFGLKKHPKLKPRIVNKPPSTKVHGAPVGKFERAPKMRKPPVARKPVATAGVKLKAKKTRGGVSKRRMTQSRRKTR